MIMQTCKKSIDYLLLLKREMKHTMTSLAASLLLLIGLATARSMSNKQIGIEKKLTVNRREVQSEDPMDAMTSNLTELQADLVNMSIPSYFKALFLGEDFLSDDKINTVRAYENKAESKHNKYTPCVYVYTPCTNL